MSVSLPQRQESTADVQNAADDRLEPREFEELVRGAIQLDPAHGLEAEFAIMCAGRLGLRAGEIAHFREEWIDWRDGIIEIPRHVPCDKGRDGGPCGYCKQLAEGIIENHDELEPGDVAIEDIMWQPKTPAAVRSVPFHHSPRAEVTLERFFETFDRWEKSRTVVNRKTERAALKAHVIRAEDVYPHALRATAATHLASDLKSIELQNMFGWEKIETAKKYVRISGERLKKSLA